MGRQSRPLTGEAMPQGWPTGAAFRAREFRRSATLCWRGEEFETDNLARQPAGMRRAATLPHAKTNVRRKDNVEIAKPTTAQPCRRDCFAEPVIGPAKGRTRWLAMTAILSHDSWLRMKNPARHPGASAGTRTGLFPDHPPRRNPSLEADNEVGDGDAQHRKHDDRH